MPRARLGVVVNPTAGSGRGRRRGERAVDALRARGHAVQVLTASDATTAADRARRAVLVGLDALVVVGGDGMVHLGANLVAGTGLPLGIVAAGSGNDVARALGLPRHDVDEAVEALDRGLVAGGRSIDAVTVGTPGTRTPEWYVAVLSAGVDAAVNARANTLRRPRGTARYVRALAGELAGFRPYDYRVTLDDGVWAGPGTLVAVANGPTFGGGLRIAPDASLDDSLLDVVLAGPLSRRGVVGLFPRLAAGTHLRHRVCEVRRSRTVLLEAGPSGPPPPVAFADGEPVGSLPLLVELQPRALRVLV
ncbi:diacylglycerol kinase family lipid kinase [Actinotalea sp. BY-33]|uniref:Diacylglycerol kinase family lipid kinase n=1 Tax=Actinotalea soli TaxID=2819234 RepID=A0A939LQT5_9CELL|nr:diacylglycerol kinase family protein [Actinotalea soli]MBO1750409.1 diacylglycerol kinase family lipid kinase [Actinotalea soli]